MSVFTSLITERIEIPHDPGSSVTIRKLNPRQLEKAEMAAQSRAMENLRALGGKKFLDEFRVDSLTEEQQARTKDPLQQYDAVALVERGVTAWDYDRKVNAAAVEDLDKPTLTFLAEAILRLSDPSLFQADEEVEAASKNG